ncbi:MAG: cysteine synthase A [Candidatus Hydrogenedentales bacterium]|jgi:cysteine synthase A
MYSNNVLNQIGNTPIVCLKEMTGAAIFAKAEHLNPGGSIKDRVARFMLEEAVRRGELRPGMTIMEPTSGNTGIGIALVGRRMGFPVTIVMPENMSEERKKIISALGGTLILTPAGESIDGAVREVDRRRAADPAIYVPQQFENPDNARIHYHTTGPEIWNQLEQRIDAFVSGLGSGGTLQGIGAFLKERNPQIEIVAVEPKNVSALLGHEPGLHKIQGIGDGFVPKILDVSLVDTVLEVCDDDAIATARALAREAGLLAGVSSGANVWAAIQTAERLGPDAVIATVLPDRAERYFSTSLI